MKRTLHGLIATIAVLLLLVPAAHAQVDRATLSGVVKDTGGGVVPGATVLVTNLATNVDSQQTTTDSGSYQVVNLIPGRYRIDVELSGFKKSSQVVTLEVGQRARVDVELAVGSLAETVTVTETAQLLNTNDATLGAVIPQVQVSNLPLAIRNWDDLLALVPGVQGDRYTEQGGGTSFGRTGGINVHGARALQNNFLLDGVDNNSISENVQELTTQVSRPSVDAIQEFKVVTSPYSAEYGRSPGAAISVSTKSGTNAFHGTGYEYFRNDKMDSIDYFSERAGASVPKNDQNQYGGNLGGPVVKDKGFFFTDYEGTRITRGVTRITRVPTADERNGIFTSAIRNPATGLPFANNTIPGGLIDPFASAIINLVPLPNQPGANNFFRTADLLDNADRWLGRADWKPSAGDSVFGRYIYSNRTREIPGAFGGVIDGTGTSAFGNQTIKTNAFVGGWTRIMSSNKVNEFRISWSRSTSDAVQQSFGLTPPAAATIPGSVTNPIVAGGLPGISIDTYFGGSGLGRIGSPDFLPKFQHTNQFEFLDSLSWLKGDHALKFGLDLIMPMQNEFMDVPATRGSLRFRGTFSGNPMADYLLGYASDLQLSNVWVVNQRHYAQMYYAQDDWKVNSRLSVNLGLRYDFMTPALESNNAQTNFNPAGTGSLLFAQDGSLADRSLVNPDRNNFAPRAGVVYKLDDRTILRGGWGIFYNLFDRVGSEDQLALNLPGLVNKTITQTSGSPVIFLQQGFPAGFLSVPSLDPASGQLRAVRLRSVDQNDPNTMTNQASAGLQRDIAANMVFSADFVYSRGRNLATLVNLNQPLPNAAGNNALGALPYPNFGFIEWRADNGRSEYKGLDIGLEKRYARNYAFGIAYTLGKAQDNASEQLATQGSSAFPQNARDFESWYGPSDYDVRQRFSANFVWGLPLGTNPIARDWTVSGIYSAHTGRPFTVLQGSNNVGTNMTGLPNVSGDPAASGPKTVDKWFDTTAFTAVSSGAFGNELRNRLTGPGFQNFDMTIQKQVRMGGTGVTFRWDIFNVFNTVNFGLPNRDVSTVSTFGSISSLSSDPRIMQIAVRFAF
ncbi:MAG TPA: carboxypeptidase regulatory-like domain-containing protein [Vicinamibacterales bacterium]|nr:carboxypeptidase regulatory-like domain-containing protein [Vicinamibacterales bacterium]